MILNPEKITKNEALKFMGVSADHERKFLENKELPERECLKEAGLQV